MSERLKAFVNEEVAKKKERWISFRKHLHQYPELSFQEEKTQAFIAQQLDEMGIAYEKGGEDLRFLIAVLNPEEKKTIALRADIDALPILEENETEYASKNIGIMHACGHDVHTSCLLGALDVLREMENSMPYRVVAVFQPAEEKLPGGASLLLKKNILQSYQPRLIIGQHVHPPLQAGQLGFKAGPYMASADEIRFTVNGKGGHAATPHECVDSVYISSLLIVQLQSLMSRLKNPIEPGVLSIGKINSDGGATNVIPQRVFIEGTLRCMNDDFRELALTKIEAIAKALGQSYDAEIEVNILRGYPVLKNDYKLTPKVKEQAEEYLGKDQVADLPMRMSAEDFAWYTNDMPGVFYRLGTGRKDRVNYSVHHPQFDVDHEAIAVGAGFMAFLAATAAEWI